MYRKRAAATVVAAAVFAACLLVSLTLSGCGSAARITTTTPPSQSTLTGNWLIVGSLPNIGPGVFPLQESPNFSLALSIDESGGQVIASHSVFYSCGNSGSGGAGYLTTTQLAADGSFTIQTPVLTSRAPTITFTVKGVAPQTVGSTWSGTYTAANANVGCSPVSGAFTAVPIQPVNGTFTGSTTLGSASGATPVTITLVLQQGSAGFASTPNFITSQNVLSGSITVQGSPCFRGGTLQLGAGSVDGGSIQADFAMNDGSKLFVHGAIEDTAVSKIKLYSALVAGGQCDKLFTSSTTDLVRQ